jgi:hypothetical protein
MEVGLIIFSGEPWNRALWLEWSDLLLALQWEGAGQRMPEDWCEWDTFRAEWFRALFDGGKECGFVTHEKR